MAALNGPRTESSEVSAGPRRSGCAQGAGGMSFMRVAGTRVGVDRLRGGTQARWAGQDTRELVSHKGNAMVFDRRDGCWKDHPAPALAAAALPPVLFKAVVLTYISDGPRPDQGFVQDKIGRGFPRSESL
jgi:hypothetical protein